MCLVSLRNIDMHATSPLQPSDGIWFASSVADAVLWHSCSIVPAGRVAVWYPVARCSTLWHPTAPYGILWHPMALY